MPTQNVNLTEALEAFVKEQVSKGHFNNASEVHRAALAAMAKAEEERDLRLAALRAEVDRGWQDIDGGRYMDATGEKELDELLDSVLEKASLRFRSRSNNGSAA